MHEVTIKLIALFEYFVFVEDSKVYSRILKAYNKVLKNVEKKIKQDLTEDDFKPLLNVYRIYTETRPSDLKFGKHVMDKMQELYELEQKIIPKNR